MYSKFLHVCVVTPMWPQTRWRYMFPRPFAPSLSPFPQRNSLTSAITCSLTWCNRVIGNVLLNLGFILSVRFIHCVVRTLFFISTAYLDKGRWEGPAMMGKINLSFHCWNNFWSELNQQVFGHCPFLPSIVSRMVWGMYNTKVECFLQFSLVI